MVSMLPFYSNYAGSNSAEACIFSVICLKGRKIYKIEAGVASSLKKYKYVAIILGDLKYVNIH